MRLIISFAALFLSIIFLQLGSGGLGPLDALSGIELNFTTAQIGLLGSAHFVGFFIGCWWAPRLMGSVGHSRAFAAFTAVGTIGILSHMIIIDAYAWAFASLAATLSLRAGCKRRSRMKTGAGRWAPTASSTSAARWPRR